MQKFVFLLVLVLGATFSACDKVDDPFLNEDQNPTNPGVNPNDTVNGGDTNYVYYQKVLLEDLTGFRCTNCPDAHNIATNLSNIYGDQLIIVNIHGSAQFSTPSISGSYTTDFRTPAAEEYYSDFFNNPALPTGSINRKVFDNSRLVASSAWAEKIDPLIGQTAPANVVVEINSYNDANRQVDVDIEMEIHQDLGPGEYYMIAYLVEDSIYDWQLDNGTNVENYLHRHVLRDNLNGTWGSLAFTSGNAGQQKTTSFQYSLSEAWKEEHCEIVAYLYHGDTREIVQVNKAWVITP